MALDAVEQFMNTLEKCGQFAHALFVIIQELLAQIVVFRVTRLDVQAGFQ